MVVKSHYYTTLFLSNFFLGMHLWWNVYKWKLQSVFDVNEKGNNFNKSKEDIYLCFTVKWIQNSNFFEKFFCLLFIVVLQT